MISFSMKTSASAKKKNKKKKKQNKQFGLIQADNASNSNNKSNKKSSLCHIFNAHDDGDGNKNGNNTRQSFDGSNLSRGQQINRLARESKMNKEVAKLAEEDASIYQYDEIYDSKINNIRLKRDEKILQDKRERKSKYMDSIADKYFEREKRQLNIREKLKLKEREMTDDLYRNKEKFVTRAYKKKLNEMNELFKNDEIQEKNEISVLNNPQNAMNLFRENLLNNENALCKDNENKNKNTNTNKDKSDNTNNDSMSSNNINNKNKNNKNNNSGGDNRSRKRKSDRNDRSRVSGSSRSRSRSRSNSETRLPDRKRRKIGKKEKLSENGNKNDSVSDNNNKHTNTLIDEEKYFVNKYKEELSKTIDDQERITKNKEKERIAKEKAGKRMSNDKVDQYRQKYLQRKKKKKKEKAKEKEKEKEKEKNKEKEASKEK